MAVIQPCTKGYCCILTARVMPVTSRMVSLMCGVIFTQRCCSFGDSLMTQNVHMQEEALVMGTAASMVEFFLVLYYGLGVWNILAGEELMHHIPLALKGALIVLFSLAVVAGTHKAAKAVKEKTYKGVIFWGLVILAMIALMTGISRYYLH